VKFCKHWVLKFHFLLLGALRIRCRLGIRKRVLTATSCSVASRAG